MAGPRKLSTEPLQQRADRRNQLGQPKRLNNKNPGQGSGNANPPVRVLSQRPKAKDAVPKTPEGQFRKFFPEGAESDSASEEAKQRFRAWMDDQKRVSILDKMYALAKGGSVQAGALLLAYDMGKPVVPQIIKDETPINGAALHRQIVDMLEQAKHELDERGIPAIGFEKALETALFSNGIAPALGE